MMMEEATKEAFGYYASELKPQSNKQILAACEICGKIRVLQRNNYRTFCGSCIHRSNMLSEETNAKQSAAHRGEKAYNWKSKIKRICEICGKEFEVLPRPTKRGGRKYCCQKCSWEARKGKSLLGKTKALMSITRKGSENPNWRGGISFEPYCVKFDNAYKQMIREKFGNVCFLCGISEEDNGKALSVHHVNYNKNCGCDDSKCICVPLCRSCHTRTNFHRDHWEALIRQKLKETLSE